MSTDQPVRGVTYRLRMPEPHTHLFQVEVEAEGVHEPASLVMPSWTPGSYLIREFARNVQQFSATDGAGNPLAHRKTDKDTWRVDAPAGGTLRARYAVYANELSVRTSHLDASHGFVSSASVFMYLDGRQHEPHTIHVEHPPQWRVTTALPAEGGALVARDYDHLADSPMEIGAHPLVEWAIDGKPHRYAIWGRGNYDPSRLVADATRIILTEKALFGDLPYPSYTIILHVAPGGSGGLEHRDSTTLLVDRWNFRGMPYESFLSLLAHEFFHVWNGKRIRPAVLGPFDYTRETYTRELWVVEGFTTYYTDLLMRRSGILPQPRYLEKVGDLITRLHQVPGRLVQSLEESSFDAWIKFYRPDAHTPNAQISYYQKGAVVALLLDLRLRLETENRVSLDTLVRALWERYGSRDVGFPEGAVEALASELAGRDLTPYFDRWLRSTDELEYAEELAAAGLQLVPADSRSPGMPARPAGEPAAEQKVRAEIHTGLLFKTEGGRTVVGNVLAGSPAHRAGINAGDELVALDGLRVGSDTLMARLNEKQPGQTAQLAVFRRDELLLLNLPVETAPPPRLRVVPVPEPTELQQRVLADWLRTEDLQPLTASGTTMATGPAPGAGA